MLITRDVSKLFAIGALTVVLGGCPTPVDAPDGGGVDGDADVDADVDGDSDADLDADGPDGAVDAEADADVDDWDWSFSPTTTSSGPATISRVGDEGLLLRGTVLTPTGVLDPGDVLIVGNEIACVAEDCSAEALASFATWVVVAGVISPGLVDAHNHLAYNFLPEWDPGRLYRDRYQWADDPSYEAHIEPYSAHRSSSSHFCPGAKWGELRSMVHGTTTIQGHPSASSSCINWGIRNANLYHGLGHDHMRQTIDPPDDIDDAAAADLIESFEAAVEPVTRYHVHMAEGIAGSAVDDEFESFAGRDPRPNHHRGVSLLHQDTAILIHSVSLTEAQIIEAAETGAHVAWSPSSNLALYGVTTPIERMLELGVNVGVGPDWTLSGEDEMLSELRFAFLYGRNAGVEALTPERLWEMATMDGAAVVGLEDHIGQLAVGMRADIAVFGRRGPDPYAAVMDSGAEDVRLVLIDGVAFFGDAELEPVTARNGYCESLDVCGVEKFLCVQDDPTADNRRDETLSEIRSQLVAILEGTGYPPEEQYGRGDELLDLYDCAASP